VFTWKLEQPLQEQPAQPDLLIKQNYFSITIKTACFDLQEVYNQQWLCTFFLENLKNFYLLCWQYRGAVHQIFIVVNETSF
jgi:hypothetical protein